LLGFYKINLIFLLILFYDSKALSNEFLSNFLLHIA